MALVLSRETAVIAPMTLLAYHGPTPFGLSSLILTMMMSYALRRVIGEKKLYCDRLMIAKNAQELTQWLHSMNPRNWSILTVDSPVGCAAIGKRCGRHTGGAGHMVLADDMTMSVLLTTVGLMTALYLGLPRGLPLMTLLIAGWTLAIARETRVFTGVLVPVSIVLAKFLIN